MIAARPRPPHPLGQNRLLLCATVAAALVPVGQWMVAKQHRKALDESQGRIETTLVRHAAPGKRLPPENWSEKVDESRWLWTSDVPRPDIDFDQLLPDSLNRAFQERQGTSSSFEGLLQPPRNLEAAVSRERVQLRWQHPQDLERLLAEAGRDPLLQVRYRIYRWRDGEEPRLLHSCETTQTAFEDTDLPLTRQELEYSVAAVLEGRYGDVPTLLDSAGSEVCSLHTLENFKLEVLDGSESRATVRISAWSEGAWRVADFEVEVGEALGGVREQGGGPVDFSTELRLEEIRIQEAAMEETIVRPEFLPDGRRKLDASGSPTFVEEDRTSPKRTVELICKSARGDERSFRSLPLDPRDS